MPEEPTICSNNDSQVLTAWEHVAIILLYKKTASVHMNDSLKICLKCAHVKWLCKAASSNWEKSIIMQSKTHSAATWSERSQWQKCHCSKNHHNKDRWVSAAHGDKGFWRCVPQSEETKFNYNAAIIMVIVIFGHSLNQVFTYIVSNLVVC